MITTSFRVHVKHLVLLQDLVRFHKGYFSDVTMPLPDAQNHYVSISFDNPDNFRAFRDRWDIFTTPIVEIQKPEGTKRLLRRLKGEIAHLKELFKKIVE